MIDSEEYSKNRRAGISAFIARKIATNSRPWLASADRLFFFFLLASDFSVVLMSHGKQWQQVVVTPDGRKGGFGGPAPQHPTRAAPTRALPTRMTALTLAVYGLEEYQEPTKRDTALHYPR